MRSSVMLVVYGCTTRWQHSTHVIDHPIPPRCARCLDSCFFFFSFFPPFFLFLFFFFIAKPLYVATHYKGNGTTSSSSSSVYGSTAGRQHSIHGYIRLPIGPTTGILACWWAWWLCHSLTRHARQCSHSSSRYYQSHSDTTDREVVVGDVYI